MTKPRLKVGMNTFVGCEVGEKRAGLLKGTKEFEVKTNLVATGYLQIVEIEKNRTWFALTVKGKEHVSRLENFYARSL